MTLEDGVQAQPLYALRRADELGNVSAACREAGWDLQRVLTDGGSEFKGAFAKACKELGIRQTKIGLRHPWTNRFVERLERTILHEQWREELRRRYFTRVSQLSRSLEGYLVHPAENGALSQDSAIYPVDFGYRHPEPPEPTAALVVADDLPDVVVTRVEAPEPVADEAPWEEGQVEKAQALFYKLFPLCQAMFYETNPIPVKTSLALMGKTTDEFRLPMCNMAPANLDRLKKALQDYGLI